MKSIKIDHSRFDIFVIIIATLLYYFLIRQYIGSVEDVVYSYFYHDGIIDWNERINSLSMAILSQSEDYFLRNGRIVIHTIVQYLCGISCGRELFFIISSLFFGLLLYGICKTGKLLTGVKKSFALVSIVILFTLMPTPGQTMMGNIAFTANYMWSCCATIWVIYFFYMILANKDYKTPSIVLIMFLFMLAGSLHEGFSIPVSGMMIIYLSTHFKYTNRNLLMVCVSYWIGTLLVVMAPANFQRVSDSTYLAGYGMTFIQKIASVSFGLLKGEYLIGVFLLCFIIFIVQKSKFKITDNLGPLFLIGFISIAFDIIVAYVGCHQLTPIALVLTLIITSYIIKIINRFHLFPMIVNFTFFVIIGIFFCRMYNVRYKMVQKWEEMHSEIVDGRFLIGKDFLNLVYSTPDVMLRFTSSKSALMHIQNTHFFETLSSVIATGKSYEIKYVLPDRPHLILEICSPKNIIVPELYDAGNYIIYKMLKEDQGKPVQIEYIYQPGIFGKIKTKFGGNLTKQLYSVVPNAHVYEDSTYLYLPIFINPDNVEKVSFVK